MDGEAGGWLWLVIDVIFVAALAAGLAYGIGMWRTRRKNSVIERARDHATDQGYRQRTPD